MPWTNDWPLSFILADADEFGPWAREMRVVHDVTSKDVGAAIDVAHNQICAWERGAIIPNLRSALKVVEAHGFEVVLRRKGVRSRFPAGGDGYQKAGDHDGLPSRGAGRV